MTEATTTAAAAATTAAAADTTTTAAATTTAATTIAAPPWHGMTEPDAAAYVEKKGWTNPAEVIKSYQNAEKHIGRDPDTLLVIPRADDPDGARAVFAKLGMPEKPEAYDMKVGLPQDAKMNDGFAKNMQGVLHKAGLTAAQAKTLVGEYNAMQVAQIAQAAKDYELNVQADKQALLDEWKGGHDRMLNRAKTAATTLGFTPELIDAIEKHVGYAKTYKLLADMGAKLGEDGLVTGTKQTGFNTALTPAEAKAEFDNAKLDPNFVKALGDKSHPGHAAATAKQTAWFRIMFPENK